MVDISPKTSAAAPPQSLTTLRVALCWGMIALVPVGIAPLLLTLMVESGAISPPIIGLSMFTELMGLAFGSVIGGYILRGTRQTPRLLIAMLIVMVLNIVTPFLSGIKVPTIRLFAGCTSGIFIWVAVQAILNTKRPEFFSAILITGQTIAQFLFAMILTFFIVSSFGELGGYIALAVLVGAGLCLLPIFAGVCEYMAADTKPYSLTLSGFAALVSIGFFMAVLSTTISYAEIVMMAQGIPKSATALVVPVILGFQILGGFAGAAMPNRINAKTIIFIALIILGITASILATPLSVNVTYGFLAILGFVWLFAAPFQVGWLLAIDSSRRLAAYNPLAQLLGLALGPFIAALLLDEAGRPPSSYTLILCAISFVCFIVAIMHSKMQA